MVFDSFKHNDLQNMRAILAQCMADNIVDAKTIDALIADHLHRNIVVGPTRQSQKKRPDNITTCAVCGKTSIIVPLAQADRTPTATHAIQCQNRPATDQPWRDGMCGHTEYIVRGNK